MLKPAISRTSCIRVRRLFRLLRLCLLLLLICLFALPAQAADFRRGDTNDDGKVDLSDAISILTYMFGDDAPTPYCFDAFDANDDGKIDLADAIRTLDYLFGLGILLPNPGPLECGPDPTTDDSLTCEASTHCESTGPSAAVQIGHVLSRLAYGPSRGDVADITANGLDAYIEAQLNPETIDESGNAALNDREAQLFGTFIPYEETKLVVAGEFWRYWKGTAAPPAQWNAPGFDASGWLFGATGIGYNDGDDATVLDDMQDNYTSVYMVKPFQVSDPDVIDGLIFQVDYDDGFVAYLNGTEIARRNMNGSPPLHTATASSGHEAGAAEDISIENGGDLLVAGTNVLAIQVHNTSIGSSDLSMIPALVDRRYIPGPEYTVINGLDALKTLLHVRGVYSRRQLQAVMAEFWENHFTTDTTKVAEYLDGLQNSDANDAMGTEQAEREAAQLEYLEYQFLYDNALGNFGDLLLFSATSPTMLIYLDNVLNVKSDANENYAREILELSAFGVDNYYDQTDIENLAECFTGWTVCKVARDQVQEFPDSARQPPVDCGVAFDDTVIMDLGPGWKYFKGTEEPAPDGVDATPTTDWAKIGFDDATWIDGTTGIGYGDNDDDTVLSDMRNNYMSVYLRRAVDIPDPNALDNLILEVAYDDGYVAYLNGMEIGRSETMEDEGTPPPFDAEADGNHEVTEDVMYLNVSRFRDIMVAGTNILAIQVHNTTLGSSDLSMLPRLLDRTILPGSMENGDPNGVWTFYFDPDKHNSEDSKTLFADTAYEITIPAGRTGQDGVTEALEVIDAMVAHPATAEFIGIKLIQKFVSDEITLTTYHDGTAPAALIQLLETIKTEWVATNPPGDIERIMRIILDPEEKAGLFWQPATFKNKVKTPIEFINSSLRVLNAETDGEDYHDANNDMGMHLFDRAEPDGWPEVGNEWVDTGTMLARIAFARDLADTGSGDLQWDAMAYLAGENLETPQAIVDHVDGLFFQETLPDDTKQLLHVYLTSDEKGNPLPWDMEAPEFEGRIRSFMGLVLSMPHWQFQ